MQGLSTIQLAFGLYHVSEYHLPHTRDIFPVFSIHTVSQVSFVVLRHSRRFNIQAHYLSSDNKGSSLHQQYLFYGHFIKIQKLFDIYHGHKMREGQTCTCVYLWKKKTRGPKGHPSTLLHLGLVSSNGIAWNASRDCPLSEHSIPPETLRGQWPPLRAIATRPRVI